MRFPSFKFLLVLSVTLSVLQGALAQFVGAYSSANCNPINPSTLIFSAHPPNNCQFSQCVTFAVAHTIDMDTPIKYIGKIDQHYGIVTCEMYATTDCSGPSQVVSAGKTHLVSKFLSTGAENRGAQFYARLVTLEIASRCQ